MRTIFIAIAGIFSLSSAALATTQQTSSATAIAVGSAIAVADPTATGGDAEAIGGDATGTGGTGGSVGDIHNDGDDTTVWAAPPAVLAPLPSGSNDELAPEGVTVGLSTPFGGVGFGTSDQKVTPSAGYTLIKQAVEAAAVDSTTTDGATRLRAEATARFLCGQYSYMVTQSVCDSVRD